MERISVGNKIVSAIRWRIDYFKRKLSGPLAIFDFSKKEKVKSVSMIVVGRNDNYGGDFSARLQTVLDWNLRYLPNPELIYIEWNTLPDKPSDCRWISERYKNSKCYIVPPKIHEAIAHDPQKMKVMEYFGKNLGIRKASSEWIILTNADVFIGKDMLKNMKFLNKDSIYGGHYVNIEWNNKPISHTHFKNKKIIKSSFSAKKWFPSTVGNFILTHKKNWLQATGYDESLNSARAGVDSNGYHQLKNLNLKTRIIGSHYHLDHPESIINNANDSHGDPSQITNNKNIPYKNKDSWGFINYPLKNISERVWELETT